MKLGVFISLSQGTKEIEKEFKKLHDLGFNCCQLSCWDMTLLTEEYAERVKKASKEYDVEVTAIWAGWTGLNVWNFYEGPLTLGIVPTTYRQSRLKELKLGSDFAKMCGVTDIITHFGFIPEYPSTSEYNEVVVAIKDIAWYCKQNGQYILFETGQETPTTLLRAIEDATDPILELDNFGINLDTANLILYGKANPVDAVDVFGKYVRNTHIKDGCFPTDGRHLGKQTPLGEGAVDFPRLLKKLKDVGYTGPYVIEREISGEQQIKDIMKAKAYIESILAELN